MPAPGRPVDRVDVVQSQDQGPEQVGPHADAGAADGLAGPAQERWFDVLAGLPSPPSPWGRGIGDAPVEEPVELERPGPVIALPDPEKPQERDAQLDVGDDHLAAVEPAEIEFALARDRVELRRGEGLIAPDEVPVGDIERVEPAVLRSLPVPAVVQTAEGEGERLERHEISAVVDEGRGERDPADRRRDRHGEVLAEDGAGGPEDPGVVEISGREIAVVQSRLRLFLLGGGQQSPREGIDPGVDRPGESLGPVAAAQAEPADLAERIGGEQREVVVDEPEDVLDLEERRLAPELAFEDGVIGVGVDDPLGRRPPIHPALVVEIGGATRRVDDPRAREGLGDDGVIAEHVAPEGRDAARAVGPEPVDADGHRGRRDIIEPQPGLVVGDDEVPVLGQPEQRVLQQPEQGALRIRPRGQEGGIALELGQEGLPFERRAVIDGIDRVEAFLIGREQEPAGCRGHGQGRAELRDPADARIEVRDLGDPARCQLDPVDVGLAVLVRKEKEAGAVRSPLGIDVLARREPQDLLDPARFDVEKGQLVVADLDPIEVGREPLGDESDGLPVRRPDGLEVGIDIPGHLLEDVAGQVVDEDVGDPPGEGGKGDEASIR